MSGLSLKSFLEKMLGENRFRFLTYLLVGGWNTVLGVSLYALLCWGFQDKVHYLLLLIPANVVAILNAYMCYKFFVFKTRGDYLSEFLRCSLVYGGAMICSAGTLFLLVHSVGLSPIVGNAISVGIVTIISYLSHTFFSFRKGESGDKLSGAFYLVLLGVACLFLLSAYRIPLFWLDEVHIVEMGRSVVSSGKEAASFMCLPDGTAFKPFYYLGPLIQEMAYRTFGYVGPRWSSLMGLLAAAVFCRWWLLRRTHSSATSFWFPLLILTHPFFNQSARLVRVDSWTLALFFAALWLINGINVGEKPIRWRNPLLLMGAGFLSAVAVYVWPTAFLFAGYCAVEYLSIRRSRPILSAAFSFTAGIIVGGFLLLLPIPDFVGGVRKTLVTYFSIGATTPHEPINIMAGVFGLFFFLLKETIRSPFIMLLCVWGVFLRRKDWQALLILLASAGVVAISSVHTFRLIYLFPLLFIFAVDAFEVLRKQVRIFKLFIALALGYGVCASILFYAFAGYFYSMRDYSVLKQRLAETLGTGAEVRVYSRAFAPYYVARDLSWTCFRYANDELLEDDQNNQELLSRVDYVIDSKKKRRFYSIEEGGALYNIVRDYCIQCAENGEQGLCAGVGRKFAFRDPDEKREKLASILLKAGFSKSSVLEFPGKMSRFGRMLLGWSSVIPAYDDLIIWKREKKVIPVVSQK